MAEQKEKKLREEDLRMLEEGKKRREEVQRYLYTIFEAKLYN
jgi:hypothetical protein